MPYRPTERTRAHAAAVRERIVVAAVDQLAEGGYASAAIARIAERAGIATGTVYRHFPSKSDLFAEVFRRASQREVDALARLVAPSAAERLAAWVEAFVRRALAAPVRAYALIAEPVDPAVEAERLVFRRAYADLFAAALRDGVERRELRPLDAELTAAAIVGALAEALVGPLARPAGHPRCGASAGDCRRGEPRAREADALVAGLQSFVLSAVRAEEPARAQDR